MFETLGIKGQRWKKPVHLSGGQRQRVAIARALCHRPRIILADEPSGSVDVKTANIIGATLKEATHDQRTGVVLVTHDLDLADAYADRFYDFELNEKSSTELHSTLRPRL
jgi:ABC-type lipoprotein export system ATPase subunit